MTDVFISYSRKDNQEDFVTNLFQKLEADSIDAWMDKRDIPPAFDFVQEINASIDAANYFMFILGPNSVASALLYG